MKIKKYFIVLLILSIVFTGCKGKKSKSKKTGGYSSSGESLVDFSRHGSSSFSSEDDFFLPEEEPVVDYDDKGVAFYQLSNLGHTYGSVKNSDDSSEKEEQMTDDQIIKSLDSYHIKYNTDSTDLTKKVEELHNTLEPQKKEVQPAKPKKTKELTVASWGPQDSIPSGLDKPSFYVIFSEPVHPISAVEPEMEKCDVFTITPKIRGVYRWMGSRQLTFYPSEKLSPFVSYKISVNDTLKSLDGLKITGTTSFSTKTDYIRIYDIRPGCNLEKTYYYNSNAGLPLDKTTDCFVQINFKVTADVFSNNVSVFHNTYTKIGYKATPIEYVYDNGKYVYKETKESNLFYLKFDRQAEKEMSVSVVAYPEINELKNSKSFTALKRLVLENLYFDVHSMRLTARFNQPIDKSSVSGQFSFSPSIKIDPSTIRVEGRYVYIDNVPAEFRTNYTCYVNKQLKDIFGQYLSRSDDSSFRVPAAGGFMKFLDSGNKILEAQYPHKFIIEHQNLTSGRYEVSETKDPLADRRYDISLNSSNAKQFNLSYADKRVLDVIDLDPYLKSGLGFVTVKAEAEYRWYSPYYEEYRNSSTENLVNIQVTDLGVTARMGLNKAVVMVRKLSDNSPVKDAEVRIVDNDNYYDDWAEYNGDCIGPVAKTDKNGFAEIKFPEDFSGIDDYWDLAVYVKKGNDKVITNICDHRASRFGVNTRSMYDVAHEKNILNFVFTDRGLYKPGETISYRGIVRSLTKDGLENSLAGRSYTAKFEKRSWYESETFGYSNGHLSREGGYSGTFEVPDDIKPGTYWISVECDGEELDRAEVTVAFFERLKFQASAAFPDVSYTLGDTINAELSASYLAGGALTGGTYHATWYRQQTDFVPPVPEAQNYVFGLNRTESSPEEISEERGSINEDGPTRIKCDTEKKYEGQPYLYKSEISVTDVSGQTIFTGAAKIIHPGNFYIGLAKRLTNGFPEKNTKVDIPYALFKPNGALAGTANVDGDIKYSFSRSYWTLSNEESVDGIYSRWVKKQDEVSAGTLKVQTKGVISFTPKNAGEYTLTVSAVDKKGNSIKTQKSFYVTGNDYWWFDSDNAGALNLSPDRSSYKPGETAQILLESPLAAGDYMITVERNDIYYSEIKHFDSPCSVIDIPVKEEYLPIVYVSICSYSTRKGPPVHKYGEPDLDKPKAYYGVTAIKVDLNSVSFNATLLATKGVCRPGEEIQLEVKAERDGKPLANAEFTLMVVDRGVLDLINYHVADPMQYFYKDSNFPLSVIGGDSRTLLMDPVTYKVKTLVGGDEEGGDELKEQIRKDFRPTAFFEPAIRTDSKGRAIVKVKMPDSLTTYRVTAFGVKGNEFALKEAEIQVQNPINIQAVQPRRMRIRDTAECGVIATNLDTVDHEVTVKIDAAVPSADSEDDSKFGLKTLPGKIFFQGETTRTVKVPAGRTKPIYFKVGAENEGGVELIYQVSSKVLKEKLISPITIEKPFIYETFTSTGVVQSDSFTRNEKISTKEKVVIPSLTKDDRGSLKITLDPTQLGLLSSSVSYCFDYPYGCLEQQSSKIWPILSFQDYIDVFGLKSKVEDPRKTVKLWFASVKENQLPDGGIPYWPHGEHSSEYVSLRFAHMYKLAIDLGYTKNEIGYNIDSLLSYLKNTLRSSRYNNNCNCYAAYMCYVFNLNNNTALDYVLDEIYRNMKSDNVSLETLAYAGLAYQCKQDAASKQKAKEIADFIKKFIVPTTRSINFQRTLGSYSYYYGMYENDSEALATIMQLFAEVDPHDEMVNKILFRLLQSQKNGYWQSTATTARVFEAIRVLIKVRKLDSLDFKGSVAVRSGNNPKVIGQGNFKGAGAKPSVVSVSFVDPILEGIGKGKPFDLEFTKDGKGALYYTTELRYAIPNEMFESKNEGLEVNTQILDENGNEVRPVSEKSKVIILESGKTYKVRASVSASSYAYYVALRIPIPSGTEIVDKSLSTGASKNTSGDTVQNSHVSSIWDDYWYGWWDWWYWDWEPETYEYFYDNEAQYFNNYFPGGNWSKTVTIRASRKGVYPTPPVTAELMYEPEVFGRGNGYLFIVK